MAKQFRGHIVAGRPVTTEDGRKAGIIKDKPEDYDATSDDIKKMQETTRKIAAAYVEKINRQMRKGGKMKRKGGKK